MAILTGPPQPFHDTDLYILTKKDQFKSRVILSELARDWPLSPEMASIKMNFRIIIIDEAGLSRPHRTPQYRFNRGEWVKFPTNTFVASGSFTRTLKRITDQYYRPFAIEQYEDEVDRFSEGFWDNFGGGVRAYRNWDTDDFHMVEELHDGLKIHWIIKNPYPDHSTRMPFP